ncbi:MAG: hypothetical protein EWM47_01465 [Anaerolineaceae bacterium]|nr:MAG: hypothetical protein EWM47_01465 [Anaerolineaceae bacterium]
MRALEEKYISFIDERIAEHNIVGEQYKADDRKDEADLEKVKSNIYEVFKTLFLSDIKQLEGKDLAGIKDISIYGGFLQRFETIPDNWKISLDKAIEHGDTTKQVIEEHKLAVAVELKERFIAMFDELGRE